MFRHGFRGKDETPLRAVVAGHDLEEGAAIEGLGGELGEEFPVQRLRQSRGRE